MSMTSTYRGKAIAVFCASSLGKQKAFHNAALSVGRALAQAGCSLVYGGGSLGIMGIVSGAVLEGGGKVTGIVPYAMVAAGGEGSGAAETAASEPVHVILNERGREEVETIVVNSMHERKVEMARRSTAFLGLPGGFGTLEEVLEVTTWNQIGIHNKPVVLLNVLSYFEPLRQLIRNGLREGFIQSSNENLIVFVDGPPDHHAQETYDWGEAALRGLDEWHRYPVKSLFNWRTMEDDAVELEAIT